MIRFQFPELFLLAIPLWLAYRRWGIARGVTGGLRIAVLVVLLISLTGPEWNLGGRGIDIIVVADRSRSMTELANDNVRELINNLANNRKSGDRIGVVTFGSEAELEHSLSAKKTLEQYTKQIAPDGSDLNVAVHRALNLVDQNRPARILVLSDGEFNGPSPLSAARRAREDGVPVDFRVYEHSRIGDVAVKSVELPQTVSPREPFQFAVTIHADSDALATVRLLRDGKEIISEERSLTAGINRLMYGDVLELGGTHNYEVDVRTKDDPLPENNRGAGVVRVEVGPRLLVLNSDGKEGNLVAALKAGRIDVDIAAAATHPLTQDALDRYRAVILENVPAGQLGRLKMARLAQFVEDLGGGLMLTGGERSFGTGGYFKSPLDEVLPVSMEIREEDRKSRIALAIALDRSGSMMAPVRGGKTKMELANLGTAECVMLLSSGDMVSVIAVDSMAHVVQPMIAVDNKEKIADKVRKIESMGGGIFVYEALVAAGNELMKATNYQTRHIILFADADDSEHPEDYKKLLKEFESVGITVSVIGLGNKKNSDAKLLEDIAKRGSGNIFFTEDAQELPRLFTQDTMSVARSSFIKKADDQPNGIPGRLLPDARLMGDVASGVFPFVNGYNLSYLKPEATMGAVSGDDYQAPWSAFWYRGLGRVAALTVEVDGQYSGGFANWDGNADYLITHARWLLGGDSDDEMFVDVERTGQDARVTVELDPQRGHSIRNETPRLIVVPPGDERQSTREIDFHWIGPDTLEARFRVNRAGNYRMLVARGNREFVRGPAVTLPYSPEYSPRDGLPSGKTVLSEMAQLTGGRERTDILEILSDPPRLARMVPLLPWLLMSGVVLLLLEIAGRRLSLWKRATSVVADASVIQSKSTGWRPRWKLRMPARMKKESVSEASSPSHIPKTNKPAQSQPEAYPAMARVLDKAKERARRRLK